MFVSFILSLLRRRRVVILLPLYPPPVSLKPKKRIEIVSENHNPFCEKCKIGVDTSWGETKKKYNVDLTRGEPKLVPITKEAFTLGKRWNIEVFFEFVHICD